MLVRASLRVSGALDLARHLLRDDPLRPLQRIDDVLQAGQMRQVRLAAPISLHVVYDTARRDDDGIVNLRQGVYGRDRFAWAAVADAASNPQPPCAA